MDNQPRNLLRKKLKQNVNQQLLLNKLRKQQYYRSNDPFGVLEPVGFNNAVQMFLKHGEVTQNKLMKNKKKLTKKVNKNNEKGIFERSVQRKTRKARK